MTEFINLENLQQASHEKAGMLHVTLTLMSAHILEKIWAIEIKSVSKVKTNKVATAFRLICCTLVPFKYIQVEF